MDKVAVLLARLGAVVEPVGVSDLARSTGIPKSTVHRLLAILERNGVVRRSGQRYAQAGTFDWAAVETRRFRRLAAIVRPFLVDLYERTGLTASLAAHSGHQARFLDAVYPASCIEAVLTTEPAFDPHCTAAGKILLAYDALFARRHLARPLLAAVTPHTITSPVRLARELTKIRRRGFAVEHQEHLLGVAAVAIPLIVSGAAFASISLSGPAVRFQPDRIAATMSETGGDASAAIRRHGLSI